MNKSAASPDQLEREIARTRSEIDRKLVLLQERLSPRRLAGQVAGSVGAQSGAFARNLGSALRDNPVPALLLGIGVLWLMVASRPNGRAESLADSRSGRLARPEPAAAAPAAAALAAVEGGVAGPIPGVPEPPREAESQGVALGRR